MRFDCLVIVSVPCTKNPVFFWQSLQILTKKRACSYHALRKKISASQLLSSPANMV